MATEQKDPPRPHDPGQAQHESLAHGLGPAGGQLDRLGALWSSTIIAIATVWFLLPLARETLSMMTTGTIRYTTDALSATASQSRVPSGFTLSSTSSTSVLTLESPSTVRLAAAIATALLTLLIVVAAAGCACHLTLVASRVGGPDWPRVLRACRRLRGACVALCFTPALWSMVPDPTQTWTATENGATATSLDAHLLGRPSMSVLVAAIIASWAFNEVAAMLARSVTQNRTLVSENATLRADTEGLV